MQISAVIDTKPTAIEAAIQSLSRPILRLMASANVELPKAKIQLAALNHQLSELNLSTLQKLELKIGLTRANLIAE